MTSHLVRRALELLAADGPIVVVPPSLAVAATIAGADEPAHGGLCSFLGDRADSVARAARLDALAARLPSGAPLVVVDHNQPRRAWSRALGAAVLLGRGFPPSRARHPTAREVGAHGFAVSALRLACGERVQIVLAHRRG